jgi:hypothetical protein
VPPAFVSIKWKTYLVFAIFCVAMTIHTFFMFPETGGKPLEDVTAMFEDPNGIKYVGTPAWKTKNFTSTTRKLERGEGLDQKGYEEHPPEEVENIEPKKMGV